MQSLINTEIVPFKATAYHNGKFVPVSDADLREAAGAGETHWAYASELPRGRSYDRVIALTRSGTTTEVQTTPEEERMVDFVDAGVIPSQADLSGVSDSELFANGQLGMWVTGTWMFSALGAAEFTWDVQIEPMINQHASHFFSNALITCWTVLVAYNGNEP